MSEHEVENVNWKIKSAPCAKDWTNLYLFYYYFQLHLHLVAACLGCTPNTKSYHCGDAMNQHNIQWLIFKCLQTSAVEGIHLHFRQIISIYAKCHRIFGVFRQQQVKADCVRWKQRRNQLVDSLSARYARPTIHRLHAKLWVYVVIIRAVIMASGIHFKRLFSVGLT